jgi:hypothetical protein
MWSLRCAFRRLAIRRKGLEGGPIIRTVVFEGEGTYIPISTRAPFDIEGGQIRLETLAD